MLELVNPFLIVTGLTPNLIILFLDYLKYVAILLSLTVQPQRRAELPCLSWNSPWLCITETSRIWEMCFPCGYLHDKGNVTIIVWVRTVKSQQLPQVFSRWGLDLRNCSHYFNVNKFYVQSAVSKADFLAYLLCNVLIAFFFFS